MSIFMYIKNINRFLNFNFTIKPGSYSCVVVPLLICTWHISLILNAFIQIILDFEMWLYLIKAELPLKYFLIKITKILFFLLFYTSQEYLGKKTNNGSQNIYIPKSKDWATCTSQKPRVNSGALEGVQFWLH